MMYNRAIKIQIQFPLLWWEDKHKQGTEKHFQTEISVQSTQEVTWQLSYH